MRRIAALACAALVPLAAVGCGSSSGGGGATTSTSTTASAGLNGTLTLGAVLPLTGASATIGKDQQRGIDLAVDQVNASGGVLGKRLVVQVEDSEGAAASAVNAARKLVSVSHVPAIVGEYSSGNTIPVGKYLQQQGVVQVNPGSSSPDVAKIGSFSFSTIGLDNIAGKFTAKQLYDAGYRKLAFLAPNNSYGSGVVNATKDAFTALGGSVATTVLYTEGQSDYRAELQRLKDSGFDMLVYTAYGKEAATINKEAFELGIPAKQMFGIYLTMCTADSDPKAVEGQQGMDVNYIGPDGASYKAAYEKAYGESFASSFNGYAYDAVELLAKAIDKAGSADPDKIRMALHEVAGGSGYDGVTGTIAVGADGQRMDQPYLIGVMKDGKLQQVPAVAGP